MFTPPPHRKYHTLRRVLAAVCCCVAGSVRAESREVILRGLGEPTGVAVRSAPRGTGVELFVAESGGVRSTVWKGGKAALPKVFVEGVPAGPITLGWLAPNTLLVASNEMAAYETSGGDPVTTARSPKPGGLIASVTANARFVYAAGDGGLLRSRRVGKRLTALRTVSTKLARPAAVAMSPLGYFVVLHWGAGDGEVGNWRLAFLDPEQPEKRGAVLRITGLNQPLQLGFDEPGASDGGSPYVLDAGSDEPSSSGIYRLDAAFGDEDSGVLKQPAAVARQVIAVERPTAFAIGPDQAIYAASTANDGEVIRFSLDQDP